MRQALSGFRFEQTGQVVLFVLFVLAAVSVVLLNFHLFLQEEKVLHRGFRFFLQNYIRYFFEVLQNHLQVHFRGFFLQSDTVLL